MNWEDYKKEITKIVGHAKWQLENEQGQVIQDPIDGHPVNNGLYRIKDTSKLFASWIAQFSIKEQHACCGIAVSTCESVFGPHNGKGLGTLLARLVIDICKALRYSLVLATDVVEESCNVLKFVGYEEICSVKNKKTDRTIKVNVIKI